jgi:hypothetical protein
VTDVNPDGREEITAAAIARLAGVGRAAVSNWRRRYPEFPQPAGGSPHSPTFDRAAVEGWLKATRKADQLATAGQTQTGTERIGEPGRSIGDLRPGELLARAMAALLPRETVGGRGSGDEWWAEGPVGAPAGVPVVLDPACGTGAALLAVADRFADRVRLAGQEIREDFARTARLRLSENASGAGYEIHAGDSLVDDQLAHYLGTAAGVVCEPPMDRPGWPEAELALDPRWEFGIPAARDGELAWVQHCYAHLRPRGVAVVAVSQRSCGQASGEHIRTGLVRSGVLRAVIALPSGMTTAGGADICLWVLRRPAGPPDDEPVRMIDLSRLGDPVDVPREFAAWRRLFDGDDPTVAGAVPRLELLGPGTSVLPSRYVGGRAAASAGDLAGATARLTKLYASIGQGLPSFAAPRQAARVSQVTLAELERVGALTIKQRDAVARVGDVLLRTQSRLPVVTPTWVDDDGYEHPIDIGGIAQVIEIDATRLDPHFVATFLRSDIGALPVSNTLGAVSRDDLRRCRIPRLPLAEQRRYGDAFRLLLELGSALRALADVSEKVIEQTIHGLTTGVLAPERRVGESSAIEGETSEL